MRTALSRPRARSLVVPILIIAVAVLASACSGRGGGWLPPDQVRYAEQATFGFTFSCDRSSNALNPQPKAGQLRIDLSYTEHGTYRGLEAVPSAGGPFSIHGVADEIDPLLESQLCAPQEDDDTANDENTLVFLGTYRVTSAASGQFAECRDDTAICRFEVVVQDNDRSTGPSAGDTFGITLSGPTTLTWVLEGPSVYHRSGTLAGGNITID